MADVYEMEFRSFVTSFAEELSDEEVYKVAFIFLPKGERDAFLSNTKKTCRIKLFSRLEFLGIYSCSSTTGLINIANSIKRDDLVYKVKDYSKRRKSTKCASRQRFHQDFENLGSHILFLEQQTALLEGKMKPERYMEDKDEATELVKNVSDIVQNLASKYGEIEKELPVYRSRADSSTSGSSDDSSYCNSESSNLKSNALTHKGGKSEKPTPKSRKKHVQIPMQETTEAGVALVQKLEELAQEHASRASSTSSSCSDSSTESHRRKSDETKVLSPLRERQPVSVSEDDGYEPVAAPTPLVDSEETPRNSPTVFRQKSPEKREKPPIKPRSPGLKRRTVVSTASEESKEDTSFVVGRVSSPYLSGSGNRLFIHHQPLPHSPLTVSKGVKCAEEVEEEEDDKTGDSGVGTGSGGGYEHLEEWKGAMTNPPPAPGDQEKSRAKANRDNKEPNEYAALTPSTKDPVHTYKNIKFGEP